MKSENLGYLYLINTIILFSTFEVVSKTLVGVMDPFQVNFIRFLIGGIILFIFLLINNDLKIGMIDFLKVLAVGIINVVLSMNLLQLSLYTEGAKASVVAVIFSCNPIFVTIFAAFLDKEKVSVQKILGLAAGMAGVVVVFIEKLDFTNIDLKSPILALASALFFGLYTVLGKKVSARIGSLKMNAYSFVGGSLFLLPFLLFFYKPVQNIDSYGIIKILYLSVLVTGIAYLTYFKGLSIIGASKGSLVFFAKPVLASLIAIIFLKEKATANLVIGTALVLLGIYIAIYWKVQDKKSEIIKDFPEK